MMRILHTEWSDGWGGQEKRIFTEMLGMVARGHHVVLVSRASCALAREAAKAGIPVFHLPFAGKFDFASVLRLVRLIRRERIDVVNTHSGIDSWVGGMAARLAGVGLVRTRHLNLPLHRSWHNFVHFLPHRLVTCGKVMRDKLASEHGFPAEQLVSIPTGIDFSRFQAKRSRGAVRAELGLAEDRFVILMAAVLRGVKRHEVALKAFAEFRRSAPEAILVLAGDGPLRQAMESLCHNLGIDDAVRFLGHREDVPDLMQAADVLLLTSRSEGVPQAVTQALGVGLPVVATAVGGVPELVIHEETGLLVEPENPLAVAAGLRRLHADAALRQHTAAAGRTHAQTHYSLEAMLDATEQAYAQVLKEVA